MHINSNWFFAGILGVLLVLTQRVLWLSHDGFPADRALMRKIDEQMQHNQHLNRLNDLLYSEVASLEHGTAAVAQHARTDLDFVKPGETFYAVVQPHQVYRLSRGYERATRASKERGPTQ
ncbi:MAG: FtsB family cell division protein [Gammaproteobacteria bacterium]